MAPSTKVTSGRKYHNKNDKNMKKINKFGKNIQSVDIVKEKKKRFFMRQYRKVLKQEGNSPSKHPQKERLAEFTEFSNLTKKNIKKTALQKAQEEFKRKNEENKRKIEEEKIKRENQEVAMKKYHVKKKEKTKRLNKRTKYGQPIMKDKIELLLEKIKSTS